MIIDLVKPWRNIWWTVCADCYFSSVPAVNKLEKIRLHFFSVVKTAKNNPMHFSNYNYLNERVDYKKMVSINESDDSVCAVEIMWLDKNLRFFVGKAEPATAEEPLYYVRWRHVAEQSDNMEP